MSEGPARDVVMAALRWARDEFVASSPWPFLVGEPMIHAPRAAMPTLTNIPPALRKIDTYVPDVTPSPEPSTSVMGLIVAPVRKRQDVFPEMITIGRTANNDVVIPDATVSKFHAYFRANEKGLELVDVGSRNGTKVMGRALTPKLPIDVAIGARLRFGTIDLTLRDAGDTWDAIRKRER